MQLTQHIFRKPHPAIGININADTDAVQRGAGKMNVMPAIRSLVHHALLHLVHMEPGWSGWPGQPDIFAAIREARETLVRDTRALIQAVGTGMTETAVVHIPAMQTRSTC